MLKASPREQWASKAGFVMAAVGSAVGLGNMWRFSYLRERGIQSSSRGCCVRKSTNRRWQRGALRYPESAEGYGVYPAARRLG
jgi:hypothetical protein